MTRWVFAYGSLVWNPEFAPAERVLATLSGYRRAFCMSSIHHRGSEEEPGLVLALDAAQASACRGMALLIPEAEETAVLAALRERELVSSAYLETQLMVDLADGRRVQAVTYVIDPHHVQYIHLSLEEQAQVISTAVGGRGPNTEYLYNTAAHLSELGIKDEELDWLSARVRDLTA